MPERMQILAILPYGIHGSMFASLISGAAQYAGVAVCRLDRITGDPKASIPPLEGIRSSQLIVADVGGGDPGVMYAVGLAQALDKPMILVSQSGRTVPPNLAGSRLLVFDFENFTWDAQRLSGEITAALTEPKSWIVSSSPLEKQAHNKVVISYSHLDREYLKRLLVHLKPLERAGLIDLWEDTRIRPGDKWEKEIETALGQASVAVLLVSADFLASDFIAANELPPILRRVEQNGTRIVPLVLKPCRFTRDNDLRHFQAVNDPARALILLDLGEQEALYDAVAAEIERVLHRS